jgi:hypothetical protein
MIVPCHAAAKTLMQYVTRTGLQRGGTPQLLMLILGATCLDLPDHWTFWQIHELRSAVYPVSCCPGCRHWLCCRRRCCLLLLLALQWLFCCRYCASLTLAWASAFFYYTANHPSIMREMAAFELSEATYHNNFKIIVAFPVLCKYNLRRANLSAHLPASTR